MAARFLSAGLFLAVVLMLSPSLTPVSAGRELIETQQRNQHLGGHNDDAAGHDALALATAAAKWTEKASLMAGDDFPGPVVCKALDCPEFKVLDTYRLSTELRRYDAATFVATQVNSEQEGCFEKAAIRGFDRLLKYNWGDNKDDERLPMTAPVIWTLRVDRKESSRRKVRFDDTFYVSLFLPFRAQRRPPKPRNPDVELVDLKRTDAFVRRFDGYATPDRVGRLAADLLRDLRDGGHRFDCRTVFVAQYTPPFQPLFRYNEIWVLRRHRRRADAGPNDEPDVPDAPFPGTEDDPGVQDGEYDDDDTYEPYDASTAQDVNFTCGDWVDRDEDIPDDDN